MNELNVANTRSDDLKKELKDMEKQLTIVKKENEDLRGEKIGVKRELDKAIS